MKRHCPDIILVKIYCTVFPNRFCRHFVVGFVLLNKSEKCNGMIDGESVFMLKFKH